jgi:hypothetical protein
LALAKAPVAFPAVWGWREDLPTCETPRDAYGRWSVERRSAYHQAADARTHFLPLREENWVRVRVPVAGRVRKKSGVRLERKPCGTQTQAHDLLLMRLRLYTGDRREGWACRACGSVQGVRV